MNENHFSSPVKLLADSNNNNKKKNGKKLHELELLTALSSFFLDMLRSLALVPVIHNTELLCPADIF